MRVTTRTRPDGVVEVLWAGRRRGELIFRAAHGEAPAGWWLTLDDLPVQLVLGSGVQGAELERWRLRSALYAQTIAKMRLGEHVMAGLPARRAARRRAWLAALRARQADR